MVTLWERFPPPDRPWSPEYVERHQALVSAALDDLELRAVLDAGWPLPSGYGVGFDERVVELPWLFAQELRMRLLDAGSALNQAHVLDRLLPRIERLHIATLAPEPKAFTERGISYVYEDLRDLPCRDASFHTIACISTARARRNGQPGLRLDRSGQLGSRGGGGQSPQGVDARSRTGRPAVCDRPVWGERGSRVVPPVRQGGGGRLGGHTGA